jgi:leader peptidase (prepilin peptidase)/N-methyltransferase
LAWAVFIGLGIALSVTDVRERRLPNHLVALLTAGGLLFFSSAALVEQNLAVLGRAALGLVTVFAAYMVLYLLSRRGIGPGDVKLSAPVGLYLGWLGWTELVVGVLASFTLGALGGLLQAARKRQFVGISIPFGPFMVAGVVIAALVAATLGQKSI